PDRDKGPLRPNSRGAHDALTYCVNRTRSKGKVLHYPLTRLLMTCGNCLVRPGDPSGPRRSETAPTRAMKLKWLTLQQLKSKRPQTRRQAVERLAAEAGGPAVDHLLPFAADPDSDVRKAVIRALGQIKGDQVLSPLMNALRDPDGEVREAAVVSLTALNDPRAVEPLTRALVDPRHEVRWRAAKALDGLGWQPPTDELIVLRAIAAGEFVKAAHVGAVAVDRLVAALRDERNPKRRAIVEALGRVGDARAVKALVAAVKDADPTVRVYAIDALSDVRDGETTRNLLLALKDKDQHVRA